MQWRENMEKGKKKLIIKILSTATVLAVAIAICTFVAKRTTEQVEASTKILQKVSDKYTSGSTLKILEVVPEHTDAAHENEEIGYFMKDRDRERDFMQVSRAKSIGSFLDATEGVSNLLMMRDYGLIKDYGVDYGNRSGYVSDNPVYSDKATFASYGMTGFTPMDRQLVYGVYANDPGMAGDYQLAEGYFIDNSGTINVIHGSVSGNSPSASANDIGSAALTRTLSVIANTDGVTEETPQEEKPIVNNQDEVTVTVEDEEEPDASNDDDNTKNNPKDQVPQDSKGTESQPGGNMLQDMEEGMDTTPSQGTYGNKVYQWAGAASDGSYEPVEEGNRFDKKLPEGITYVGNGTGNVRFTESSAGKYFGFAAKNLYYNTDINNYFHNGEWFKELVFGDKNFNINISIETKTPGEITTNLNAYDLIYISGKNATYINKGVDFSDSQVMEIYNAVVSSSHKAVIMDYALIDNATVADKAAAGTLSNIEKLALLLWQKDQTAILTETISGNGAGGATNNGFDVSTTGGDISMVSYGSVSNNIWYYLTTMAPLNGYGNFVAGSVYVYEHRLQFFNSPKAQVDAYDFFGNGDFNSAYVDTVVAAGLSQVEYMVQVNNANHPTEKMSEQITPAVVVQYILSYDGTASELVKEDLRILEIEPCRDFSYNLGWGSQSYAEIKNSGNRARNAVLNNREEFIKSYLGEPFVNEDGIVQLNIDKVRFTSMTIEEFICINDNIREEYDIIYIGSNHSRNAAYETYNSGSTGNYKTTQNKAWTNGSDLPREITDFRDDAMDGMVYFNIGDTVYVTEYGSQNPGTPKYKLWGSLGNNRESQTGGKFRYAARDLTTYKMKELLDYLDTGYPIIVAGDMLKTGENGERVINPTAYYDQTKRHGYDHGRIDNSSVMYEFFQAATGQSIDNELGGYSSVGYDNFISEADVKNNTVSKEEVIRAVNTPKLSMNLTARPAEYEYAEDGMGMITGQTTLTAESDGKYYLEYEFTLQNLALNSVESDIYTPKLYVDVNADGKFSESEELEGGVISNALTGIEVPHTVSVRGNVYSLTTNVLYRLRREVPDGYQGVLPWCLKVEKSLTPSISASETGYCAIQGEEAALIKILQITKNGAASNLNLEACIAGGNNNYYGRYINGLKTLRMFELQVTTVDQNTFVSNYGYRRELKNADGSTAGVEYVSYYSHLDDFDMLVLGFGDNYEDTNQNATDALEEFIAKGKPVLLTHDFMAHYPAYTVVSSLRDVLGMDRYGVTVLPAVRAGKDYSKSESGDSTAIATIEGSGRRVAYQPGSNKQILIAETQGFTYFPTTKYASNGNMGFLYLISPDTRNWSWNNNQNYGMFVDKVNDGQITNYPYKLPDAFAVNNTHAQYFQPNMEADQDQDGTADITIWYTLAYGHSSSSMPEAEPTTSKLSDGVYNISPKDGVNNFYIFNSGNVTYTGSGHSSLTAPPNKYEAQLFVNTLVAAYRAGVKKPAVSIYDGGDLNSSIISNIVVPYDENVGLNATNTNKSESSIIKDSVGNYQYPFVSETAVNATRAYFRVSDPNLIKGTKEIKIRFLIEVPTGTTGAETITLDNGEVITVTELTMPFYSADFTQTYASGTSATSGVMYGVRLPMNLLMSSSNFKIYVEAQTFIKNVSITGQENETESGKSYASLGVTKMDLLKLD